MPVQTRRYRLSLELDRYGPQGYGMYHQVTSCLSVIAVVDGKIYCTYSGITSQKELLKAVSLVAKPFEVLERTGIISDLIQAKASISIPGFGNGKKNLLRLLKKREFLRDKCTEGFSKRKRIFKNDKSSNGEPTTG